MITPKTYKALLTLTKDSAGISPMTDGIVASISKHQLHNKGKVHTAVITIEVLPRLEN